MIVLSANDITKQYGTDVILKDVSFALNAGDRVGVIGLNGAGKTTLLHMLAGELIPDEGNIYISNDMTVGYLRQQDDFLSENTVMEEVECIFSDLKALEDEILSLSEKVSKMESGKEQEALLHRIDQMQVEFDQRGGYTYKGEMKGILTSMAFGEETFSKKISVLSGGERTRLALCCLLLKKPDLLLLDEPTNHLDIGTLKWLEGYLRGYTGTIIIVSHDRYFLDQSVNRIFEIQNHKLKVYEGNYSTYAVKRKEAREAELRAYSKQQTEIVRQEEMIRRMKQHGTEKLVKRAQSREKRLEHLEIIEAPDRAAGKMKLSFKENFKSGNDVIEAHELAKGFGYGRNRQELFRNVELDIKRGEKICIVGPNGVGKTTLLKILLGEVKEDSGRIKYGYNLDFAYYDQGQKSLNPDNTVLEELKESYSLYTDTEMRNILGRFLFRNDDVFISVGDLSGGEKARLTLVKIMLSGANVLVLDEPTNHLDIDSKEVFEEALLDFPGTVIVVSHDRYFLNRIPTRILELEPEGIREYLGKYDYYEEKKASLASGKAYLADLGGKNDSSQKTLTDSAAERKRKKEKDAEERRFRRKKEALEKKIEELEEKSSSIENEMLRPNIAKDHVKLSSLSEELDAVRTELSETYDEWMDMEE